MSFKFIMTKCTYCNKGILRGNLVSHAKNRTKRIFKPNIHKYKVKVGGITKKVNLCTKCIKRIKKFGRLGIYFLIQQPVTAVSKVFQKPDIAEKKLKEKKKEEKKKAVDKLKIEEIVGKKNQ